MTQNYKFLIIQLKSLYETLDTLLSIIISKITKMIEIQRVKNAYSLQIQLKLERKTEELKKEIDIREKRSDIIQKRIDRIKSTIERMEKQSKNQFFERKIKRKFAQNRYTSD